MPLHAKFYRIILWTGVFFVIMDPVHNIFFTMNARLCVCLWVCMDNRKWWYALGLTRFGTYFFMHDRLCLKMILISVLLYVQLWISSLIFSLCLQLNYVFPRILMLQEPLLVVVFFYIFFIFVVIYVRLDFSISKVFSLHLIVLFHNRNRNCIDVCILYNQENKRETKLLLNFAFNVLYCMKDTCYICINDKTNHSPTKM